MQTAKTEPIDYASPRRIEDIASRLESALHTMDHASVPAEGGDEIGGWAAIAKTLGPIAKEVGIHLVFELIGLLASELGSRITKGNPTEGATSVANAARSVGVKGQAADLLGALVLIGLKRTISYGAQGIVDRMRGPDAVDPPQRDGDRQLKPKVYLRMGNRLAQDYEVLHILASMGVRLYPGMYYGALEDLGAGDVGLRVSNSAGTEVVHASGVRDLAGRLLWQVLKKNASAMPPDAPLIERSETS